MEAVDHFTLCSPKTREGGDDEFIPLHYRIECCLGLRAVFLCGAGADDLLEDHSAPCILQRFDLNLQTRRLLGVATAAGSCVTNASGGHCSKKGRYRNLSNKTLLLERLDPCCCDLGLVFSFPIGCWNIRFFRFSSLTKPGHP